MPELPALLVAGSALILLVFGVLHLVFGYLALAESTFLFGRPFLLTVGALALAAYLVLARRYWFSAPLRGVMQATALYAAALVLGA